MGLHGMVRGAARRGAARRHVCLVCLVCAAVLAYVRRGVLARALTRAARCALRCGVCACVCGGGGGAWARSGRARCCRRCCRGGACAAGAAGDKMTRARTRGVARGLRASCPRCAPPRTRREVVCLGARGCVAWAWARAAAGGLARRARGRKRPPRGLSRALWARPRACCCARAARTAARHTHAAGVSYFMLHGAN
jgi:hypothetical protein